MAHGVSEMLTPEGSPTSGAKLHHINGGGVRKSVGVMGSRRIFSPAFKLKVLQSYRNDLDCRGNQRATARKYNIHRRQIQKWLQCEASLRNCCATTVNDSGSSPSPDSTHPALPPQQQAATLNPSRARLHGDEQQQQQPPPPPPQPQPPTQQQPPSAVAATGYRFLPQHYDYPQLMYPAQPPAMHHPYPYAAGFQPPVVHHHYPQEVVEPLAMEIKRERASPASSPSSLVHQHLVMKKERLDEEVCNASFSSGISDSSISSSPEPSHLESLPPSPRESSSGSDSDEHHAGANTTTSLARRRSFSLRFKLRVIDAFYKDKQCNKNQRATARKFNINRRQVQKWLNQEHDLRDPTQHRGANRQRLGSHSPAIGDIKHEETPVDLRTQGLMEYGNYRELSPNSYVDTALTPPYSQPGCTLSCCSQEQPTTYYCYSPPQQPSQQEQPLCLVKPKAEPVTSTVPTPPAATPPKKDAILFKPYLDNPVSKPSNNNSHETCNLNDIALDVSFRPQYQQQQQQTYHPEIPQVRSAFVRYPAYPQ